MFIPLLSFFSLRMIKFASLHYVSSLCSPPITDTSPLSFSLSHLLLSLSPSFFRFAYLMTEALEAAHTR